MPTTKPIQYLLIVALTVLIGSARFGMAQAADKSAPASNGEFDGASFTCLNYTNGLGDNASTKMQSALGHLWMEGYLAGYYKAQGKLELSDDKGTEENISNVMLQRCRTYPAASILTVTLQAIAKDVYKIPAKAIADISMATYTCGEQVDARAGTAGDANKADLAELWTFAFIQGYKNVTTPNMVIPLENKPVLVGAVTKYCGTHRDLTLLDMTAQVADKVKLQ